VPRIGVAAGVSTVGIAVLAAILVPLDAWTPWLAWPGAVLIVAGAWRVARPVAAAGRNRLAGSATAVLALVFALWNAVLHSEHVVLRRDGGAYGLYTQWIANHHGLPIPVDLAAFGGSAVFDIPRFTVGAPAYYQVLHGTGAHLQAEIAPQFLIGAPAVYSFGWWAGAAAGRPWTGMQVVPALLTGLALIAFGALASRLVGPAWAPVAVAVLGLCYPVVWVSRTTFSEPAALVALLAGLVLALEAVRTESARTAWSAGAVVGLAGLIRVDAVREVALLVAVCAVLAVRGNRAGLPIAGGAVLGTVASLGWWYTMARPYVTGLSGSLLPLFAGTAAIVLVGVVAMALARRRPGIWSSRSAPAAAAPRVVAVAVLLFGVVLASRPLWQVVRQDPTLPVSRFVASLQHGENLPIDPGRLYTEHSLDWVSWYLGRPAVVIAWVVFAALAGRAVGWWLSGAGEAPDWLVPFVVVGGSAVLVLLRPGITPDHPWADRRLVPTVLPGVVLAAVAGLAWATRRSALIRPRGRWRARGPGRMPAVVAGLGAAVLLIPAAWASAPVALLATERGEVAAVDRVCRSLRPEDVVVAVDGADDGRAERAANEWVQVIRGVCGHPSAALLTRAAQLPDAVTRLASLVAGAGGRLVLLAAADDVAHSDEVLDLATSALPGSGVAERIDPGRLDTLQDRRLLTRRPPNAARLVIEVVLQPVEVG
jgi:hypothetical protein